MATRKSIRSSKTRTKKTINRKVIEVKSKKVEAEDKGGTQFFYISGLPRSGSSLLINILNQNQEIYASPTSGLYQIIKPIMTGWDGISEFKANANERNKKDLIRSVFDGYYKQFKKKIIFDKCRGWPIEVEMLQWLFNTEPKIILCVRDVRDIFASWEKMYRKDKAEGRATPGEAQNPNAFKNIASRCEYWADEKSPLGSSFNVIVESIHRGHKTNLYFFEYEKWTTNPVKEFAKLNNWLGIPQYKYDFNNVKQLIKEKDEYYGYADLHNIKEGQIIPYEEKWPDYLTKELSEKYISSNIWMENKSGKS